MKDGRHDITTNNFDEEKGGENYGIGDDVADNGDDPDFDDDDVDVEDAHLILNDFAPLYICLDQLLYLGNYNHHDDDIY